MKLTIYKYDKKVNLMSSFKFFSNEVRIKLSSCNEMHRMKLRNAYDEVL